MIGLARCAVLLVLILAAGQVCAAPTEPGYSADGLYNLANSYARAGKPGLAVLNYERADLLKPNDPDIEANLHYVLGPLHLAPESRGRFARAATLVSPLVAAWIGVAGLAIAGLSLLFAPLRSGHRWLRRLGVLSGVAMMALTLCNGIALWPTLHDGVVISASTPVRVAPVPMGDPLFVLPEAETVRISAVYEGFVLVQTRAGRTGWASSANVAPVVP
jgi:hypothetical protein